MEPSGTPIRARRIAAGISQAGLAARAGISRQAYSSIEHGSATPATDVALRLARVLGASVEALFGDGAQPDATGTPDGALLTTPLADGRPMRADVHRVGKRWIARPLAGTPQHPAIVRSLPVANALIHGTVGADGASVDELLSPPAGRSIVVVGCDPSVAVVAAHLAERGVALSWHEMGSVAALRELAAGNAHVAGCHLLDPQTRQYNLPAVVRYLPFPTTVVTFAVWDQGLLAAPGNPKRIRGVEDLSRPGIFMVNREEGSGSRALLNEALSQAGVPIESVAGYDRSAYSHLSVAEAVGMGLVDTGVAVRAAAIALGLDFVPLGQERYDLVIPNHFLDEPAIVELLSALRRPALRRQIEALGGYDVASMGVEPAAA